MLSESSTPTDERSNVSSSLNKTRVSAGGGASGSTSGLGSSSSAVATTSTNSSVSLYPPNNPPAVITTNAPRFLPHLQPQRFLPLLGHASSSPSPTSTCSSPVNHHLLDTSSLIPGTSAHLLGGLHHGGTSQLTPPQSAPPQKTSHTFFVEQRIRSKSGFSNSAICFDYFFKIFRSG